MRAMTVTINYPGGVELDTLELNQAFEYEGVLYVKGSDPGTHLISGGPTVKCNPVLFGRHERHIPLTALVREVDVKINVSFIE